MKKTILITGGLGYIGSSLVQHFKGEYNLIVVDNLMYNQMPLVYPILNGVEFHKLDVVNDGQQVADLAKRADIIIPLAALVGAPLCKKYPNDAKMVNLDAVKHLVSSLRDDQLVIFPNTNSGYGDTGGAICTEETPIKALSLYGSTKDEAEKFVLYHNNSVVFRLATVFGYSPRPRLDLLVNTLAWEAYCGVMEIFDDSFMRNYIHVKDICRAFEFAISYSQRMVGQVYNLGNDKINMTKGELATQISNYIDCRVNVMVGKTDPDKRNYIVSSAKLYALGWTPKYDLEYGIKELRDFFDCFSHLIYCDNDRLLSIDGDSPMMRNI